LQSMEALPVADVEIEMASFALYHPFAAASLQTVREQ
jgi:hypothetical protein